MENHRGDYPQWNDDTERKPMPRWMATVYVLVIVGGIVLAYLAWERWVA